MVIRRSDTDQCHACKEDEVGPGVLTLSKETFLLCSKDHKDTDDTDDGET